MQEEGFLPGPAPPPQGNALGDAHGERPGLSDADLQDLFGSGRPNHNPYMLDMRGSLFIAGVLHIIHDLTRDLLVNLHYADRLLNHLRHICRLLSNKWSRRRFVESCCSVGRP